MKTNIFHDTIKISREFKYSRQTVYNAYKDINKRVQWSAPANDEIKYSKNQFKIGGLDKFRCGTPKKLEYGGEVCYLNIVPNELIVASEKMTFGKKNILATTLMTMQFHDTIHGCQLNLTFQIVAFGSKDMIQGYKSGWKSVLAQLEKLLAKK